MNIPVVPLPNFLTELLTKWNMPDFHHVMALAFGIPLIIVGLLMVAMWASGYHGQQYEKAHIQGYASVAAIGALCLLLGLYVAVPLVAAVVGYLVYTVVKGLIIAVKPDR